MEFYEFAIHRKLMKQEIQWNKIKWFRIKIREISLFRNQKKLEPNLGENEEQIDFKRKINYLNLVKTQITARGTIESHFWHDCHENLAPIHADWRVLTWFIPRRTFGVQGENSIDSNKISWSIPRRLDLNWV